MLYIKKKKEAVVWLPVRQLSTRDPNDTEINNYRSPCAFIVAFGNQFFGIFCKFVLKGIWDDYRNVKNTSATYKWISKLITLN